MLRPSRLTGLVFTLIGLACCAQSVPAQGLTFVDANEGFGGAQNLFAADGSQIPDVLVSFPDVDPPPSDDDKWGFRPRGSSGSLFSASDGASSIENAPELRQTLTGLTSGQQYDVYAAYWSTTAGSWGIRAGLSSNPSGNQIYTSETATIGGESAVFGTHSALALWSASPVSDENNPAGPFVESGASPNTLYLGFVGTATAAPDGSVNVFIDDLSTDSFQANNFTRSWFDGLAYVETGSDPILRAIVDRETGAVSVVNNTGSDFSILGVSVTSAAGGLESSGWQTISSGSNSGVTDTDPWDVVESTANELSESEVTTPAPTVVGATLGSAGLPLGQIWFPSQFEDVEISLTFANSAGGVFEATIFPQFVGDAPSLGDFNGMGGVDVADYEILISNLHSSLSGLSQLEAYKRGDINGDFRINFLDIDPFIAAYELVNGQSSFAALSAQHPVPEPLSAYLLLAAAGGFGLLQRRRTRFTAPVAIAGCLVLGGAANAQTHVNALGGPDGNTVSFLSQSADDWFTGAASQTDNLWRNRGGLGIDSLGVYEAWGDPNLGLNSEMAPDLVTTISNLTAGAEYRVWVDYVRFGAGVNDYDGNRGGIEAGLVHSADMTLFGASTDQNRVVGGSNLNGFESGDQRGLSAYLGTAVADANGALQVFVGSDVAAGEQRTWFDGVTVAQVVPELTLEVNTTTGAVTIRNDDPSTTLDIRYYEVRSSRGSLAPETWSMLDTDPDTVTLSGWQAAGGSSGFVLSENNFDSMLTLAPTETQPLGAAFQVGSGQDLRFYYAAPGGQLTAGDVVYVQSGLVGDYNGDGSVDAADYTVWRDNLNGDESSLGAGRDPANSGPIGEADYTSWKSSFGNGAPASLAAFSSATVPEPASQLLLMVTMVLAWKARRRPYA